MIFVSCYTIKAPKNTFKMSVDNSDSLDEQIHSKSINDYFPNEILEEILCKLSSNCDLCHAKLVCHRWRVVVDELVGHDFIVTSFSSIIRHLHHEDKSSLPPSLKDLNSLEVHSTIAIRKLVIGVQGMLINDRITQLIQRISLEIPNFPHVAFPHALKSLSCYEPLPPNIFTALTPIGHLQYLNLSLFSIASLSKETFQNLGIFRDLSTLKISNTPSYPEFNSTSAIAPLNNFLKHAKAPQITVLDIAYPIRSLLEIKEDSTQFLINFMMRSLTIKKLSIEVCSPNQDFAPPSKLFQYPITLLEQMKSLGKRMQLDLVELKDNHLHSLRPSAQTKAWIVFVKEQKKLSSLKFYLKSSIEFTEDVVTVIENNVNTLTNVELSCFPSEISASGDVYFVPIDGRCLAKCLSLQYLSLSDKTINTSYLPKSLNYIYVDAMLTNMDAHHILLSDIPVLRQIELKDIRGGTPKGFGYGITIATLRQFVRTRTVIRLIIYAGSTDEKYPAEGIHNGDDNHPKQLRKRKAQSAFTLIPSSSSSEENLVQDQVRIDWRLNEWGFYENKDYDDQTSTFQEACRIDNGNAESTMTEAQQNYYKCDTLISGFH